jgi:hypothetical protein
MIIVPLVLFAAAAPPALTADQIMARVAENQDRAQQMRTAYVYHQEVLIRLNRSNGKLGREEYSEYTVTPTSDGSARERTLFRGKYFDHGKTMEFDQPGFEHKKIDLDAGLVGSLSDSFVSDRGARDGIERDLFPLSTKQQRKYNFKLEGADEYRGMPVYRVTFEPEKKPGFLDADEAGGDQGVWAGEVLVHRDEFQPVLVATRLAPKVPVWVKTVLGTDVQQLGFKVSYQKFDDGVWFPVTYGGEFKFKALFFYSRRVGVSMKNSGFQRAVVDSKVRYADIH